MMRCLIISSSNHSLPAIFIIFILSCSLACSNFPFSSSFYVMLKIAILWINKYICINVCTLKTNERMVEWDCLRGLINYYVVLFFCFYVLWFFSSHFNGICRELLQCPTSYFMLYRHWCDDNLWAFVSPKEIATFSSILAFYYFCSYWKILFHLHRLLMLLLSRSVGFFLFSLFIHEKRKEKIWKVVLLFIQYVRFIRNFFLFSFYLPFMSRLW